MATAPHLLVSAILQKTNQPPGKNRKFNFCRTFSRASSHPGLGLPEPAQSPPKCFFSNTTPLRSTSTGVGPPNTSSNTCTRFFAGITRKTNARIPVNAPFDKNHFVRRQNTILHRHGIVSFKAFPQFFNDRIGNGRNIMPKMHETADSTDVLDVVEILFEYTTNKNVTRKQRFHHPHHPSFSRPLYAEPDLTLPSRNSCAN